MKKILLIILVSLLFSNLYAQKITIKGVVKDTANAPIVGATVLLLKPSDSTLILFAPTQEDGTFFLKLQDAEPVILKISAISFSDYVQKIDTKIGADLGTIILRDATLNEVQVIGEKNPITIKKDTLEFNAGSFKTRPNASVEELLKKMPGFEVDRDGNVKAQGQDVQKILVNGKEFFGNDPKMATKNLPADAIEKVQVFDKKSDQAVFSGIDDGQKTKTINLETKEKDKRRSFGKFMGGYGTDNRYEGRLNFNSFNKVNQLSLLGMGNNINQTGFSFGDYMDFIGMNNGGMGRGNMRSFNMEDVGMGGVPLNFGGRNMNSFGLLSNLAGGVNINQEISKNLEINGNYFLNSTNNVINKVQDRETFLPNNTFLASQTDNQQTQNYNHRLNLNIEYKIDTARSLKFTSNASYNQGNSNVTSFAQTIRDNNFLQNTNDRLNTNDNNGYNYNLNLLYRQRFRKKGRTFSTNLGASGSNQNQNGILNATNIFYNPNLPSVTLPLNQTNNQVNYANSYSIRSSFTEPLASKMFLEINHLYQINLNEVSRNVFDVVNDQRNINQQLTNAYTNTFDFNRIGTTFRLNNKKTNFSVGVSGQFSNLNGSFSNNTPISKSFNNILPSARFRYSFKQTQNLNIDYDTEVRAPSVQQLQPVINNTDPLNISKGNPELRPEYTHRGSISYVTFDPISFSNFFLMSNINYTMNSIVNAQTITENLVRTTQPVNTRGNLNIFNNVNYGFRVKKFNSRMNISANMNYTRGLNLLNNQESFITQQTYGTNIRYDFEWGEKLDFNLRTNLSHQQTQYDFNANQNQTFFNEVHTGQVNIGVTPSILLSTEMNYMVYRSLTNNFYQELPMWNASISSYILKDNKGEIKFSVVNILDRNLGITQSAGVNYLQQERIVSLGRYMMVSFTYSLSKVSRKKNPMQRMISIMGG
jgi:hypothetical protein